MASFLAAVAATETDGRKKIALRLFFAFALRPHDFARLRAPRPIPTPGGLCEDQKPAPPVSPRTLRVFTGTVPAR